MNYQETKSWLILRFGSLDKALADFQQFPYTMTWTETEMKVLGDYVHNHWEQTLERQKFQRIPVRIR